MSLNTQKERNTTGNVDPIQHEGPGTDGHFGDREEMIARYRALEAHTEALSAPVCWVCDAKLENRGGKFVCASCDQAYRAAREQLRIAQAETESVRHLHGLAVVAQGEAVTRAEQAERQCLSVRASLDELIRHQTWFLNMTEGQFSKEPTQAAMDTLGRAVIVRQNLDR